MTLVLLHTTSLSVSLLLKGLFTKIARYVSVVHSDVHAVTAMNSKCLKKQCHMREAPEKNVKIGKEFS